MRAFVIYIWEDFRKRRLSCESCKRICCKTLYLSENKKISQLKKGHHVKQMLQYCLAGLKASWVLILSLLNLAKFYLYLYPSVQGLSFLFLFFFSFPFWIQSLLENPSYRDCKVNDLKILTEKEHGSFPAFRSSSCKLKYVFKPSHVTEKKRWDSERLAGKWDPYGWKYKRRWI